MEGEKSPEWTSMVDVPGAPPQGPDTSAAGRTVGNSAPENTVESEEESSNERPPERPDTTSNSHEDTEDLTMPQEESGSRGSSLETSRRTYPNPSTVKMCSSCFGTGETRLPDDRNLWRINKIDIASYEEICKLLDNDSASKKPLLSAFPDCFNQAEAFAIKLQFSPTGGVGMAKMVLGIWGNYKRSHTVGALKVIVNDVLKRDDVIEEIEKWEKRCVCHGCGIRLKESI